MRINKDIVYLVIISILVCACLIVNKVWAGNATAENGNYQAIPVGLYGTQADGTTITIFRVDDDGVVQTTT